MSQSRTRYFLLGSTAILVGGLALGTAAYMGGLPMRALASQAGPDDLALVPSGAAIVAYANVHDVMQSEFRQRLTAALDSKSEGRHEFQEHTGIDVERDIDSVVAAAMPGSAGDGPHEFAFIAMRGRFNTTRIEELVTSKGGRMDEYRGARLLLAPERDDHDADADHGADVDALAPQATRRRHAPPALALVNANLVVVGSLDAVKAAIDRHQDNAGTSILSDGEFVRMLESLDGGSTMWVIGRSNALLGDAGDIQTPLGAQMPGVKWVAASGYVNGGLRATVKAEANDAESGKNLREIVQGVLAMARLQLQGKPELSPLLQGLQVQGSGTGVSVTVAVPTELLDVFLAEARRHAGDVGVGLDRPSPAED